MANAEVLRTESFSDAFIRNFNTAQKHVLSAVDGADEMLDSVASFLNREQEFEAVAQAMEPAEVSDETPGTSIKEEITAAVAPAATPVAAATPQEERKVGQRMLRGKVVLVDRVSFVLGVVDVALTAFWLGADPGSYQWFWLLKSVVLFTLRYFSYRRRRLHYMLFEFCYAGNLLAAAHFFLLPRAVVLRRLAFAHMAGPLMWSIVAMRNSLVFHDADKMTTLMMHASPALLAWTMRWRPLAAWTAGMTAAQAADFNSSSWWQMSVLPMAFYLPWAIGYYVLIFILLSSRIQARGYESMFTEMVSGPALKGKKSALSSFVLGFPERLQPVVYLGMHMTAAWVSLLPVKLLWDHYWLHTTVLLSILLIAAWNGANFYFKVFAKRYLSDLQGREGHGVALKPHAS